MAAGALNGRFELRRALAHHATGTAMLAWDDQLRRTVVLKRLRGSTGTSERIRALLGAPAHANLALVRHDFSDGADHILVMDHAEGRTLADRLDDATVTPLELDDVLRWLQDVAAALDHLHGLDPPVGHGDVKPANVVVTASSRAVLVDLGADDTEPRVDVHELTSLAAALVERSTATSRQRRIARRAFRRGADAARPAGELVRDVTNAIDSNRFLRWSRRIRVAGVAAAALVLATLWVSTSSDDGAGTLGRARATDMPLVPAVEEPVSRAATPGPVASPNPTAAGRPLAAGGPLADVPTGSTEARAAPPVLTPARLGVYTMSPELGQFDVYRMEGGATPVAQRRTTGLLLLWSHIATLGDGWLFFYRAADGEMGTAPVERDGRLGYGDATLDTQPGWTHVVGVGDEVVWLYRSDTGAARVVRFVQGWLADDDSHDGVGAGYDRVTPLGGNRVLHYDSASGRGAVLSIGDGGEVTKAADVSLPRGWAAVGLTGSGHVVGVDGGGRGQVLSVAGSEPAVTDTFDIGAAPWAAAVGFDLGLVVSAPTGRTAIAEVDADGRVGRISPWAIPAAAVVATVR